ncbi:MSHA biogenesis protein MshF [Shewanella sp. A32]|uniref:MSHA biogenesis protein MshF n=1 Tax=Shewanella sp. A32 TaxID=3031327 RepID=UPI0023B91929|nr:MSHA biogenesis protein MshF [Shewanella sp. A32]MDF0535230.1 MSHA biogenesis protein MshF [Shewanella sp. A32]
MAGPQRSADDDLMSVFRQLIAVVLLLLFLGILGSRYFNGLQQVADNGLQVEHNRLLNLLAMVRSQWLTQGKPAMLKADWQLPEATSQHESLLMDKGGWPLPVTLDVTGCDQLWLQLLGASAVQAGLDVSYQTDTKECQYRGSSGQRINYQLSTGRVIFLTAQTEQ